MRLPLSPLLLALTTLTACSLLGSGQGMNDSIPLYDGPVEGSVVGTVLDPDGLPIEGVTVSSSHGVSVLTDSAGYYHFDKVSPAGLVLTIDQPGWVAASRATWINGWETRSVNFKLAPVGMVFEFPNSEGGEFAVGRLSLSVPPYAFSTLSGETEGTVSLSVTAPDLLRTGVKGAPGDFSTIDELGQYQGLASFGFWELRVSIDGQEANVAPDSTVGFTYDLWSDSEIPAAQKHLLTDTMPLWWWNLDTALWEWVSDLQVQENDTGRFVSTELPHFSSWNLDYVYESSCVDVTVIDAVGNPISGAEVTLTGLDYIASTASYTSDYTARSTNDMGQTTLWGIAGGTATLQASTIADGITVSESIDPYQLGATVDTSVADCPNDVTIVLPICVIGGDIWNYVTNSWTIEAGEVQRYRIPSGAAMFYGISPNPSICDDPLAEMDIDEWFGSLDLPGTIIIEPTEDGIEIDAEETEEDAMADFGFEPVAAGDIVRLEDDLVELDFTPLEGEGGGGFYIEESGGLDPTSLGERILDGTSLGLVVQGEEDGIPGFEAHGVTHLPSTPTPTEPGETVTVDPHNALELEIEPLVDNASLYVIVPDADGGSLMGRVDASTGIVRIPEWVVERLPSDQVSNVHLFRYETSYTPTPRGDWLRIQTMNAANVSVLKP